MKKIVKKIISTCIAVMLLFSMTMSAYASVDVNDEEPAGPFGYVRGRLSAPFYMQWDEYTIQFHVSVDNVLANGYIRANIEAYDENGYVGREATNTEWGQKLAYWYYDFHTYPGYKNKTYVVYGAHEAIYTYGYVVYTSNTYRYDTDAEY